MTFDQINAFWRSALTGGQVLCGDVSGTKMVLTPTTVVRGSAGKNRTKNVVTGEFHIGKMFLRSRVQPSSVNRVWFEEQR